jgi:hypothetical protein
VTLATDPVSAARDAALRHWSARAAVLIWDRLADARAHAQVGRVHDAGRRLGELQLGLVDGSSRNGSMLGNARAAFYRNAFREEPHDLAIHQVIRPDAAGELVARSAPILGRDQHADLRAAIAAAGESLRRLAASMPAAEQFSAWEARERDRLTAQTRMALSNAQIALSEAVGFLRVKPELR